MLHNIIYLIKRSKYFLFYFSIHSSLKLNLNRFHAEHDFIAINNLFLYLYISFHLALRDLF